MATSRQWAFIFTRACSQTQCGKSAGLKAAKTEGAGRNGGGKIDAALAILTQPISMPVNVDLPLAVGIPADYINDQDLRLRLYRRIADLRDETEIEALASEFQDRFGPPPEMVQNLFYQMRVKLRAEKRAGWLRLVGDRSGRAAISAHIEGKEERRLSDLGPDIRGGKGAYWCTFGKVADWMQSLLETLDLVERINRISQLQTMPARGRLDLPLANSTFLSPQIQTACSWRSS